MTLTEIGCFLFLLLPIIFGLIAGLEHGVIPGVIGAFVGLLVDAILVPLMTLVLSLVGRFFHELPPCQRCGNRDSKNYSYMDPSSDGRRYKCNCGAEYVQAKDVAYVCAADGRKRPYMRLNKYLKWVDASNMDDVLNKQ